MNERPVQRPDCRAIGAKPARFAACPASTAPSSGIAISQGKGGDVGDAGNASQDGEAIGEACVRFDQLENCRFDRRDLPIDLFEALTILTFQQRERESFSAGSWRRFDPSPGPRERRKAPSVRTRARFEPGALPVPARRPCEPGSAHPRDGSSPAFGRLGEAARQTRIDLDERNARCAEGPFESAMIRPGRFEHGSDREASARAI